MDAAGLRCPDIDPIQLIDRRSLALAQLGEFRPRFDQILADFRPQVLVDLNDLESDFGNLALRLSDHSCQLATLAFEAGGIALEGVEPRDRHQTFARDCARLPAPGG